MKSKTHTPAQRRRHLPGLALILAGFLAALLLIPRPAPAAGLLIADGGFGGILEIEEHDVRVTVNNGIVVTEVTQVFRNTENRQLEALYTFPVPKGASVSNFSMWINGKEMIGEVLEKKRAREIYESYKQNRQDPGLLEQVDYKTFEMRVFPIGPNAAQRVQIAYYQELDFDNDWATYVYPLSTATRAGLDDRTTGRFSLNLDARSAIPITALESPSHPNDFVVTSHGEYYRQASLELSEGSLARDFVLAFQSERPRSGIDIIFSRVDREDGYFQMTVTAGEELAKKNAGMDYVFVLDISGSMAKQNKLQISQDSIGAFIDTLSPADRFELISFNVSPTPLFSELTTATVESSTRAMGYLNTQDARGGTRLEPALQTAYKYASPDRTLNVIVLSDGMTDQGERNVLQRLIGERPTGARVFCIGVGNEVNRPLLRSLAEDSGGLASFISHGDNFERQAAAFRRKLQHPAATELEISFSGGGVYDVEPKDLPNLYHGAPLRIYGRYEKSGPIQIELKGDLGGRSFRKAISAEFPASDEGNPEIERMWAWHRIQQLMENKDAGANQAEIVRLGEAYSIVSEFTSFLVLENDAEYKRWKIERRNALRIERDRREQRKLQAELEALRDKTMANLGPAAREATEAAREIASAAPGRPAAPRQAMRRQNAPAPQRPANQGFSVDFPSGGGTGAGAMDPFSAGLALLLGAAALAARNGRKED